MLEELSARNSQWEKSGGASTSSSLPDLSRTNLTDKRFPGRVAASYRSLVPVRITGDVENWEGHTSEELQAMRDGLALLRAEGNDTIED
jgi:hypothetical protein